MHRCSPVLQLCPWAQRQASSRFLPRRKPELWARAVERLAAESVTVQVRAALQAQLPAWEVALPGQQPA